MPTNQTPGRPTNVQSIIAFTANYMLAAVIGAIVSGNREFIFYIVIMLVLLAAVFVVHYRVRLSKGVLWGLSLWGLAHMAGGLVPVPESWPINGEIRVLYSWWLIPDYFKFDHLVHAYGFAITTWLCWEGLRAIVSAHLKIDRRDIHPTIGMLTLCGAASMGFGALNEVIEFVATLLVPETNVGDYANTGWDLVSNLGGILIAVVMIRLQAAAQAVRRSGLAPPVDEG